MIRASDPVCFPNSPKSFLNESTFVAKGTCEASGLSIHVDGPAALRVVLTRRRHRSLSSFNLHFEAHSSWLGSGSGCGILVAVGLTGDGAGQAEEQGHLLEETLQEVLLLHGLLKTDHKSFVTLTHIYCHIHNSTPPF